MRTGPFAAKLKIRNIDMEKSNHLNVFDWQLVVKPETDIDQSDARTDDGSGKN